MNAWYPLAPNQPWLARPTSGSSPENAILRQACSNLAYDFATAMHFLLSRITPCLENGKTAFVQSYSTSWPKMQLPVGVNHEQIVIRAIQPDFLPKLSTYLLARDPAFRAHAIQKA